MIDMETKLKVIKDSEGGKVVMVIAHQSGSIMIFKNKNKIMEAVNGSASLNTMRLTFI